MSSAKLIDQPTRLLSNQVVIITGASRGLGKTMALAVAKRGATVIATARTWHPASNSVGSLDETVSQIEAAGGEALAIPLDVRDETQVQRMLERILNRYGRIDVLVNNAGLMVGDVAFTDLTPQLWRDILDTNLAGAFLCCAAVVPTMIRQRYGVIVNITSGAAVRPGFLNLPYGVSKAGLDRLTLGLATELKASGVACLSLSPPVSATLTVRRLYPARDIDTWAQPPELSAQALCTLLGDDPLQYTGKVVSVREYLRNKGVIESDR